MEHQRKQAQGNHSAKEIQRQEADSTQVLYLDQAVSHSICELTEVGIRPVDGADQQQELENHERVYLNELLACFPGHD